MPPKPDLKIVGRGVSSPVGSGRGSPGGRGRGRGFSPTPQGGKKSPTPPPKKAPSPPSKTGAAGGGTKGPAASVAEVQKRLNAVAGPRGYHCASVSWEDVQRGTVGGVLSCIGSNIADVRLWEKSGKLLYTLRSQNWNERLGMVSAKDVLVVVGNTGGDTATLTLAQFLGQSGDYTTYAGLESPNLVSLELDNLVSIRFQTVFLPVEEGGKVEFCTEVYSYNTRDDSDPRNLLMLCTPQGVSIQPDTVSAQKLFFHKPREYGRSIERYYLMAEASRHKVGGQQKETEEERQEALAEGKAVAQRIGIEAMGTRMNVQMLIQVPLEQKPVPPGPPVAPGEGQVCMYLARRKRSFHLQTQPTELLGDLFQRFFAMRGVSVPTMRRKDYSLVKDSRKLGLDKTVGQYGVEIGKEIIHVQHDCKLPMLPLEGEVCIAIADSHKSMTIQVTPEITVGEAKEAFVSAELSSREEMDSLVLCTSDGQTQDKALISHLGVPVGTHTSLLTLKPKGNCVLPVLPLEGQVSVQKMSYNEQHYGLHNIIVPGSSVVVEAAPSDTIEAFKHRLCETGLMKEEDLSEFDFCENDRRPNPQTTLEQSGVQVGRSLLKLWPAVRAPVSPLPGKVHVVPHGGDVIAVDASEGETVTDLRKKGVNLSPVIYTVDGGLKARRIKVEDDFALKPGHTVLFHYPEGGTIFLKYDGQEPVKSDDTSPRIPRGRIQYKFDGFFLDSNASLVSLLIHDGDTVNLSQDGFYASKCLADGPPLAMCCRRSCSPGGVSSAARVSMGSLHDKWDGSSISEVDRDPKQHISVTVTMYYTVSGGIPSDQDVRRAVDDLDRMYRSCRVDTDLRHAGEVTAPLLESDVMGIYLKIGALF